MTHEKNGAPIFIEYIYILHWKWNKIKKPYILAAFISDKH